MMGDESGLATSEVAHLIPPAYEELRRIARRRMARLPPGCTLTPTDLVNEALLRLMGGQDCACDDVDHLIALAARAMHNVLVDRARRRSAAKRGGGGVRVALSDEYLAVSPAPDMLSFHEACETVRRRSEAHFELILLRVYAGLTAEEIARRRNQSARTVEREWRFVKKLLGGHFKPGA
jgi:RNA polymerase sigma factor (TIGR02999 family)